MNDMPASFYIWAIVLSAAVTIFWRQIGYTLVSRLPADHPAIIWASYVAYATASALLVHLIFYPEGALQSTPLIYRFLTVTVAGFLLLWCRLHIVVVTVIATLGFSILLHWN